MPDSPDNIVPITQKAQSAAQAFGAEHDSELLTILFTDLCDSTQLQNELGNVEAARLTELHRRIVREELAKYDAREIEWAGDSCLAVFMKPSEGVIFALRLQAALREARATEPNMPTVRIGLHLGEIVVRRNEDAHKHDLFGLQVSEAARVMSLASGNQIYCTRPVFDNARAALKRHIIDGVHGVQWMRHGFFELKGSDEPAEVFEVGEEGFAPLAPPPANDKCRPIRGDLEKWRKRRASSARSRRALPAFILVPIIVLSFILGAGLMRLANRPPSPTTTPDARITSVAVLPLDNLMNDPEQDYFVDGMTEAITGELSKISALKVISRTSAMTYKDTDKRLPEIADELGVRGLVEGAVLREDDTVSIRVRLYDGPEERPLWTQEYSNTLTSALKLQAEVALAIADEIRAEVEPDERRRIADKADVAPEALEAYLRGRQFLRSREGEDLTRAIKEFERAIAIDSTYASAYVGISDAILLQAAWAFRDPEQVVEEWREAIEHALRLDASLAEAQASYAFGKFSFDLDAVTSNEAFHRAIQLEPNDARTHHWYAVCLDQSGRIEEALSRLEQAASLDPRSRIVTFSTGLALMNAWRYSEAEDVYETLLREAPEFLPGHQGIVLLYLAEGRAEEAVSAARRFAELRNHDAMGFLILSLARAAAGQQKDSSDALERAKLLADQQGGALPKEQIALVHLYQGDAEASLDMLDELRICPSGYISVNPLFAPLHDEPRFWQTVERMGYPLLPPGHPVYPKQHAYLVRKAAEELLEERGLDEPPPIDSIAVLPLDNLMNDPAQDYFVDGMTEAITSELSKISSLKVISRTSAMTYKDSDKRLPEIASELGVRGLVEGSVFREDDTVSIRVRLYAGSNEDQLWTQDYSNTVTSLLKLQAEVALAIADEIRAEIEPDERRRIADKVDVNPDAMEAYLRGRQLIRSRTRDDMLNAVTAFEQAIELDESFAVAYSGIADAHNLLGYYEFIPPGQAFARALTAAKTALELDGSIAEAHASLGWTLNHSIGDWQGAEKALMHSVELDPNYFQGQLWLGGHYAFAGRYPEAIQFLERAEELGPRSVLAPALKAGVLYWSGETARATAIYEDIFERQPDFLVALQFAAPPLFEAGRREQALAIARRARTLRNNDAFSTDLLAYLLVRNGQLEEAKTLTSSHPEAGSDDWLYYYAALGDVERVLQTARRRTERGDYVINLAVEPRFDAVRGDDRFWGFLQEHRYPLLPVNHPYYTQQQTYLARKAAKVMLKEVDGPQLLERIAVLPFENYSGDPEQQFFVNGMTDALTAELQKISELVVISSAATRPYRDTTLSPKEIADELGVDGLVSGSVFRSGNEIRIMAELTDPSTLGSLWSETYDDTMENVVNVQGQATLAIAEAVRVVVTEEEQRRIAVSRDIKPAAYDAYLRGLQLFDLDEPSLAASLEALQRAVDIEPSFADAWSRIGLTRLQYIVLGFAPSSVHAQAADAALRRALDLDPRHAKARSGLASLDWQLHGNYRDAEKQFREAIAIAPNDLQPRIGFAHFLVSLGRRSDAAEQLAVALQLEPENPEALHFAGYYRVMAGDKAEGLALLEKARGLDPDRLQLLANLSLAYQLNGMLEEAVAAAAELERLGSGEMYYRWMYGFLLAAAGQREKAGPILTNALSTLGQNSAHGWVWRAWAAAALGDLDGWFESIDQAIEYRDPLLAEALRVWLYVQEDIPAYKDVLADPRHWDQVERLELPQLPPEHPGYAEEQGWLVKHKAEELLAEQGSAPQITSLAVLPLDNYSNEPDQEYFVDGMTDALTAELSKVGSLKVIARTSAMRYKNTELTIREIARELGVDALIEGSVYRSGDDVRITAQLVRGDTEDHIWGESYEETIANVIALQGRMAVAIVEEVSAALTPEEERRITFADSTTPEAYDAYLRAQHALRGRNRKAFESAEAHFETALAHDPDFAPAYAGLAQVYALQVGYGMGDRSSLLPQSRESARKALAIDPESADAHAALGVSNSAVSTEPGNWREAEKHLLQAIRLQPGLAIAHAWLGMLYTEIGRLDQGLKYHEKSVELDPLGSVPRTLLAENLIYRREYERAESILNAVLEDDPTSLLAVNHLQQLYSSRGYTEAEIARLQTLLDGLGNDRFLGLDYSLLAARARLGQTESARAAVAELEVVDTDFQFTLPVADIWFALGNREKGFQWLERQTDVRGYWPFLRNAPGWDPIRDDDRYWALMERLGFPPFPPGHPLFEMEQEWLVRRKAEELMRERNLVPAETVK